MRGPLGRAHTGIDVHPLIRQVLLVLAAASCATSRPRPAPIAAEKATSAPGSAAEQIYKAVLDTLIGPHGVAVMPDSTSGNWNAEGLVAGAPPGFEAPSSALAGSRQAVTPPPGLAKRIILVTGAAFAALVHGTRASLQDQFGSNAELTRLSPLGLSADSARAVMAIDTWRSADSVQSELLFLSRSADGMWQVIRRDPLYIDQ
jgi:hypothetical protein